MTESQVKNQRLPKVVFDAFGIKLNRSDRDNYIRELLSVGWTLTSLGEATGMTRERIRQIAHTTVFTTSGLPVPRPPLKPAKVKPTYVEPSAEILERLLELQPLAQKVRSSSSKYREEAEEYTRLIAHAHLDQGVTLYRLAKRLGVTHGALRFRLVRYGYLLTAGKSKVYNRIEPANRKPVKGS